ncbi:MAG: hypothetical protein A3D96_01060 [Chlamydiae bacterium RIFCSPHIGHO2_12_FULL_44_59]|nr:MAG: hypothetical protein A2796_00635 [Chlamydiae bacterium RIFCSPHIGHO2_01_FULL_44_39]OGN59164.1 MAG: hypothetical protein A3C42_00135 [Chlamydiae bacterium RIFCSPHIGHO2_02_FULL_45_9]OGN60460.1 MAG: hypothetical protein A3D96_01060 [Chlamydiae bacterium RIFCSPHIGHO2_12_FULL_44_59]OGN66581.1 MAG: hypothetical protein A2978_05245 [Chlamydiae bacterium RIFCSPLOWO2_01_FULL_44_52]OGN69830.1 MAG: hypothetical protein A3I67_07000 [Chlamydiae bacterium RIFCSPLOWO2_02_FULL_45_22]OGN70370.1 MAG: hyp
MKAKKRQKLCYHCEGDVDLEVIVCPFCAADLRVEKPEVQRPAYNPGTHLKNVSTQASLYPSSQPSKNKEEAIAEGVQEPLEETEEEKTLWAPMIFLTLGFQLFLLGLLMLFFSHGGILMFKWDARFWFFYILAAFPLVVFGYKKL